MASSQTTIFLHLLDLNTSFQEGRWWRWEEGGYGNGYDAGYDWGRRWEWVEYTCREGRKEGEEGKVMRRRLGGCDKLETGSGSSFDREID
jgi:hypothetical protein